MIQSQELRIWNYVGILGSQPDRYWQVAEIQRNYVRFPDNGSKEYKNLLPIPLNQEWFDRFGFNYCKYDEHDKGGIQFFYDYTENEYYVDGFSSARVKYVHQLQNLYFALTGTELTLQP